MQLKINNVAKIREADIDIDGITVIAGENNTGKSTIGKLIFAIFNSMSNMEEKIQQEKNNEIDQIISLLLQNYAVQSGLSPVEYRRRYELPLRRRFSEQVIKKVQNGNVRDIRKTIAELLNAYPNFFKDLDITFEFVEECSEKLESILNVSDRKIMVEVITRWFNQVFENQLSPLSEEAVTSKLELIIKEQSLKFTFEEDTCVEWDSNINLIHQAFYIDNPFVVDYMSSGYIRAIMKTTDSHLIKNLRREEEDIFDSAFNTVLVKDKLSEVYDMLKNIVGGEIIESPDREYYLNSNQYARPINIKNLSTGLKSFALIKKLLENGSLKEKDVLVLDEPEIHLHPEWQLAYAELIVLLQKKFDLTIVITTHSPYFLDAVDVFSAKHEVSDKVNYYLAENDGKVSYLKNVTDHIDAIYKKLSDPMQELENIRSTLR